LPGEFASAAAEGALPKNSQAKGPIKGPARPPPDVIIRGGMPTGPTLESGRGTRRRPTEGAHGNRAGWMTRPV